jgi:hypothetical protein
MKCMATLCLLAAVQALGQSEVGVLVTDRTNDRIWLLTDTNDNGVIDEPDEVRLFFSAANAAGTPGPLNPNTIGARADGLVVFGDQDDTRRMIISLRDLNCDGDAMDEGESMILVGPGNASGVSFAFPTGIAFDPAGRLYVVNAGNAFGNDGIYRVQDLNNDGDAMDEGEVTDYVTVGAFGPGNGAYSPQEIVFGAGGVLYLRNSSSGLHGVYACRDLDENGRADDAGEFSLVFGAGNASGHTPSAGFAIDLDVNGQDLLYHSLGTGSADQILRLRDLDGDGSFQGINEGVLAFSTTESGFTSIDVTVLPDGTVLFSDNSGLRIIALRDLDGDGLFNSAGERTTAFANSAAMLGAVRSMAVYHFPSCAPVCDADVNCDGSTDGFDVEVMEQAVGGDTSNFCQGDPDFNRDGSVDGFDVESVEQVVGGAPCP